MLTRTHALVTGGTEGVSKVLLAVSGSDSGEPVVTTLPGSKLKPSTSRKKGEKGPTIVSEPGPNGTTAMTLQPYNRIVLGPKPGLKLPEQWTMTLLIKTPRVRSGGNSYILNSSDKVLYLDATDQFMYTTTKNKKKIPVYSGFRLSACPGVCDCGCGCDCGCSCVCVALCV